MSLLQLASRRGTAIVLGRSLTMGASWCSKEAPNPELATKARENPRSVTESEWRKLLSRQQFEVARNKGTERAFTGHLWDEHQPGEYLCVCCAAKLFSSETKFDSGSGWPSFYDVATKDAVERKRDDGLGVTRTEVLCKRCGGHLGHVFEDGPKPTGLRYCINSASLTFKAEEKE